MTLTSRPFVASGADGRHIPERDDALAPAGDLVDGNFEDYEDWTERWVSVAVSGSLVVLAGLYANFALQASWATGTVVIAQLIFGGITVMFVGCFIAYVAYPSAIPWVALAGVATIAEGLVLIPYIGTPTEWLVVGLFIAIGLAAAALGVWRATVSWIRDRQEDWGPSPS